MSDDDGFVVDEDEPYEYVDEESDERIEALRKIQTDAFRLSDARLARSASTETLVHEAKTLARRLNGVAATENDDEQSAKLDATAAIDQLLLDLLASCSPKDLPDVMATVQEVMLPKGPRTDVQSIVKARVQRALRDEYRPQHLRFLAEMATGQELPGDIVGRLRTRAKTMDEEPASVAGLLLKLKAVVDESDGLRAVHALRQEKATAAREGRVMDLKEDKRLQNILHRLRRHQAGLPAPDSKKHPRAEDKPRISALTKLSLRAVPRVVKKWPCLDACKDLPLGIVVYVRDRHLNTRCVCKTARELFDALTTERHLIVGTEPVTLGQYEQRRVVALLRRRGFPIAIVGAEEKRTHNGSVLLVGGVPAATFVEGPPFKYARAVIVPVEGLDKVDDAVGEVVEGEGMPSHLKHGANAIEVQGPHGAIFRPWAPCKRFVVETAVAAQTSMDADASVVRGPYLALTAKAAHKAGIHYGDEVRWRVIQPPIINKLYLLGPHVESMSDKDISKVMGNVVNIVYQGKEYEGFTVDSMEPMGVGTLPPGDNVVDYQPLNWRKHMERSEQVCRADETRRVRRYVQQQEEQRARNVRRLREQGIGGGGGGGSGSAAGAGAGAGSGAGACPICMEDLEAGSEQLVSLSCGHVMHEACFENLKASGTTLCPTCRQPFLSAFPGN